MKNLVKILLVVSVFTYGNLAFGQTAATQAPASTNPTQAAQVKITPEQRAEKRAAELKTRLGLTDDQTTKVKEIFLKNESSRNEAMKAAGQDKDARIAAAKNSREQLDSELGKVFTADQLAKYKSTQAKASATPGNAVQPKSPAAGTQK